MFLLEFHFGFQCFFLIVVCSDLSIGYYQKVLLGKGLKLTLYILSGFDESVMHVFIVLGNSGDGVTSSNKVIEK